MDQILFANHNAMADAFTLLLALYLDSDKVAPSKGRVFKRTTRHHQNAFVILALKDENNKPVRWVCVEFFQQQGYFYLYALEGKEMSRFLPPPQPLLGQTLQFNLPVFLQHNGPKGVFYTIEEIEKAAIWGRDFLYEGTLPPTKTQDQIEAQLGRVLKFASLYNPVGRVSLTTTDLAKLIAKHQ